MYKFKQVFEISEALVKKQVKNQVKKYCWFFFLCDVKEPCEDPPTPLKTHPPPKHDVITECPLNGFSINPQGKKQTENKICY